MQRDAPLDREREAAMTRTEVIKVTWGGHETAASMSEALLRHARVDIVLPASMHHAIVRHLNPDAELADPQALDVSGGAELVSLLATVDGLEALAELAEPAERAGYRLHLRSPAPVLSLIPPQMV
jgi:hypothetical protein